MSRIDPTLTAEQFEAAYAARSKVSVEFLHRWGRFAERCHEDCDYEDCDGWVMGFQWEDAIFEDRMRDAEKFAAFKGFSYQDADGWHPRG